MSLVTGATSGTTVRTLTGDVLRKSSISCHPSELREGAAVIDSMAFSRQLKRPTPSPASLSPQRLLLLTSAKEAFDLKAKYGSHIA
jgi:hypothetical protein